MVQTVPGFGSDGKGFLCVSLQCQQRGAVPVAVLEKLSGASGSAFGS